jgi:hypothetical protein
MGFSASVADNCFCSYTLDCHLSAMLLQEVMTLFTHIAQEAGELYGNNCFWGVTPLNMANDGVSK